MDVDTHRLSETTHTLTGQEGEVLGVAFQVPILDARRPGSFLLTTGHSVRTLYGQSRPVQVRPVSGAQRECQVLVCSPATDPIDLALLYVDEWLGEPLPCTTDCRSGTVLVRGAPAGVVTEQANFQGELAGAEFQEENALLDIVLPHLTYVEPAAGREIPLADGRSTTYEALRGLSGGPICIEIPGKGLCAIGFVMRRNDAGIANRVYGLPMARAAEDLAAQGVTLQLERRPAFLAVDNGMLTGLIGQLIKTSNGHHQLWGAVSGLFYSGEPIDRILTAMVRDPDRYGLVEELHLARTEFLLGRLLLKKDVRSAAVSLMRRARSRAYQVDLLDHDGLAALIDLRLLVEGDRKGEVGDRGYRTEAAIGRVGELAGMPEEQRAYEMASAAGREAMIVCADYPPPWPRGSRAGSYFRRLEDLHGSLLRTYEPTLRDKQEIVQIGLAAISTSWDRAVKSGTERHDRISELIQLGQVAAKQRSNAIFYSQMLLLDAALSREIGRELRAFALACLTADALRQAGLQLSHEGISSILAYLKSEDVVLWRLIQAVHRLGIGKGVDMIQATAVLDSAGQEQILNKGARVATILSDQLRVFKDVMSVDKVFIDLLAE